MIIVSWNINSITQRLLLLKEILQSKEVEVLLLQETKCQNNVFPYSFFQDLGYKSIIINGEPSYNGVAVISKHEIISSNTTLLENDSQARYIEATIKKNNTEIKIINVYVPNGQDIQSDKFLYKLKFLNTLYKNIIKYKALNMLVAGDFNVAINNIDVYSAKILENNIGFHIKERKILRKIIYSGITDALRIQHPHMQAFSWWDYRKNSWKYNKGMRIDYILLSPSLMDIATKNEILTSIRDKTKTSDHAPILCNLNI